MVINKILIVRGKKVMIDTDLAELYAGTEPMRKIGFKQKNNPRTADRLS